MSSRNLIIYNYRALYNVLSEISSNLNFETTFVDNENSLKDKISNLNDYMVLSNKNYPDHINLFVLHNLPINIFKLIENINTEFLKNKFNTQSEIKIKDYSVNLNSRVISLDKIKLKLTEKEIYTIIYLSKSNNPVSVEELQSKVWGYQFDLETHTVETHIYRLRKKFLTIFNDDKFIISTKDGYQIN